jgi:phenylpropionate dioxygenase-like ring-hydroxylating dioxygenase large terminal subunit
MRSPLFDPSYVRDVVQKCATCIGPVKDAEILPAEAYVSEDFWEFEKRAIFSREWLAIGHVNEVPKAGDQLPLSVNDEPVIVVRDDAGAVRVLSAICQHRGHPLVGGVVEAPPAGRCLNARRLVCPYHNWVYGLDGALVGAPSMSETTPIAELRRDIRLPEIRSEIFHGLIFVTFSSEAPPLAPSLARLDHALASYKPEDLIPGFVFAQTDQRWNWKLHHENALEPYHTDYVHKGYHTAVPSSLTQFCEYQAGDGHVMRTTGFESDGGDLFEKTGNRRLPEIEGLTNEQRSRVLFVSIMPSVVMVVQPSFVTVTLLDPTAAGRINLRRLNLYSKAATDVADFERICSEQFERMKIIIMQDQVTQMALQEAYKSRYAPRGRLSYLETAITQLNSWVVDKYRRGLEEGVRSGA